MQRVGAHVTDDRGRQILEAAFPAAWIKRRLPDDYGVDYEIEIVDGQEVTGKRIWAQLKSTTQLRRVPTLPWPVMRLPRSSREREHVRYRVETSLLDYAMKCDFPLMLMLVDTSAEEVYWLPLRDYVEVVLDQVHPTWRSQQTVTLHIDACCTVAREGDDDFPGLRWYALDPGRRSALGLLALYHHELQYQAVLSGYRVGPGDLEGEESLLLRSAAAVHRYLQRALSLEILFGARGDPALTSLAKPALEAGLTASEQVLTVVLERRFDLRSLTALIGPMHHAVDTLLSSVAAYQRSRGRFVLEPWLEGDDDRQAAGPQTLS